MRSDADVLVVGAGPSGLATAASLRALGVSCRLVDKRGETGGAYNEIRAGVQLTSPRRYTALPGLAPDVDGEYVTAGQYREYLAAYARRFELVAEKLAVASIERDDGGFRVRFSDGEEARFRFVVVATGFWDHPIVPDIPGLRERAPTLVGDWKGPRAGERVLVLGGASSAIEVAEECAREGLTVTISARSGVKVMRPRLLGRDVHDFVRPVERLPRFLFGRYCDRLATLPGTDCGYRAFVRAGRVRERGPVVRFEGLRAVFSDGRSEEFDRVVVATGYRWSTDFLPPVVERATAGHPRTRRNESVSWPGLFFVGTPCARGLASEYLRGIAEDASEVARAIQSRRTPRRWMPAAAALAVLFYVVHAIDMRAPLQLLACCNAAAVLVALGLARRSARWNALGFLWFTVGTPCWLIDVATGGTGYVPTTVLTHLGSFALGAAGVLAMGIPRGSWWRAMLSLIALQQLSRLLSRPEDNLNLAWAVHHSASGVPYPLYYALLTAIFSLTFLVAERLVPRLGSLYARRP